MRGVVSRPILQEGRTCWRRSPSARVAFLVDGKPYFAAVADAMEKAQRRITIIGWDFNSGICLQPEADEKTTLAQTLHRLVDARKELHVYILIWRGSVFYGDNPELFELLFSGKWAHPRIHFKLDDTHPVASCHHQKIVSIDDAIAFVGGIDLTTRRWDDHGHTLCHEYRAVDGESYPPVHDVQVLIDGAAASDIAELTRQRWFNATGERVGAVEGEHDPWPESVEPSLTRHSVGVARTQPRHGHARRAREIKAMLPVAVARAERAIYFETQYFALPDIAHQLVKHLRRPDGPEIVIVATRRSKGVLEQYAMAEPRDRLFARLRRADRYGRLGLFYAVSNGNPESEINIHSKVTIVDDYFVRIGSANLNRRSMGVDTECDIAIEAERDDARDAIAALRNRLIAEHLCAEPEAFEAAVAAHGSMLGAIEQLNRNSRCLVSYATEPTKRSWLLGRDLFDPVRPLSLAGLWARFIAGWTSKARAS